MSLFSGQCRRGVQATFEIDATFLPERAFDFANAGTIVVEQDAGHVGGCVWDAEVLLAHFIDGLGAELRGRTLLELGAGTGLASLVAVRNGARAVATELDDALPLLVRNIERQKFAEGECEARALRWGSDATGAATFDFVVAADCIYEPAVYDDLLRTLSAFSTPDSRILLCYEQRRRDLGPFFERFGPERGFHGCERVADSELLAEARSLAGVHLWRARRCDTRPAPESRGDEGERAALRLKLAERDSLRHTLARAQRDMELMMTLHNSDARASARVVHVGDRVSFTLAQFSGLSVAGLCWPSSRVLAECLVSAHSTQSGAALSLAPASSDPRWLVELGCGACALVSMAMAWLGFAVTATDLAHVIRRTEENLAGNEGVYGSGAAVNVAALDWNQPLTEAVRRALAPTHSSSADGATPFPSLVVASDTLYDGSVFASLARTLAALCGPDTRVYLAYQPRKAEEEATFFALAQTHGLLVTSRHSFAHSSQRTPTPDVAGVGLLLPREVIDEIVPIGQSVEVVELRRDATEGVYL